MKKGVLLNALLLSAVSASAQIGSYVETTPTSKALYQGVDMGSVEWTDGFWKDRFDLCMPNIVPAQWDYFMGFTEDNFKIVGDGMQSDMGYRGTNWQDGDYYKWLEAQISVYSVTKDPELLRTINERAERIVRSIADDGYITLHTQIGYGATGNETDKLRKFVNSERWIRPQLHETYNMGHFLVMAMTHYRVTGSPLMLDAGRRVGDYLNSYFDDVTPEKAHLDYNSVQMMGMMELYRSTGDERYLECVNRMLSARGQVKGSTQNQNDTPLRKSTDAVGHAVLAPVLYIGATDYCTEADDEQMLAALKAIWEDIYTRKASVTGGLGNVHAGGSEKNRSEAVHEAFGLPYSLSNSTAYNETCATFYGAYFSWRLFLLTGEMKYVDAMERAFYNNLSSMALDGKSYFYTNVLRWHGHDHRLLSLDFHDRWTTQCTCVCCPTSLVRFVAQTKEYAYVTDENSLYVTLYGSNTIETELGGKSVAFVQESGYPWQGDATFEYCGDKGAEFSLKLRIPSWAAGSQVKLNGKVIPAVKSGEFASVANKWRKGDRVELMLDMKPTLIEADPRVEQLRSQAAVVCGPIVYCVEGVDLPDGVKVEDIVLPTSAKFSSKYVADMLGGVNLLESTDAKIRTQRYERGELYAPINTQLESFTLKLVPYYAWHNRGESEMAVFMPITWE